MSKKISEIAFKVHCEIVQKELFFSLYRFQVLDKNRDDGLVVDWNKEMIAKTIISVINVN